VNTVRIQNTLENLFQDSPHWLHSGRRVVFWYDPDEQFTSTFDELQIEGVEKLQVTDNPFTIKHRLLIQQPNQNFLLYIPKSEPTPQDNWLFDIQKSGLTFSADPAALIYADLGLRQRSLEITIREHQTFFNSRKRKETLEAMKIAPDSNEPALFLAMLSVVAGLKVPDAGLLIRRVLMAGLLESDNLIWSDIEKYVSPEIFWEIVLEHTDFPNTNPSLNKLFTHLLITHFHKSLRGNIPKQFQKYLENYLITPGQRAYAFIDQWMRDQQDSEIWKKLSNIIGDELNIFHQIEDLEPDILCEAASFEDVDKVIIRGCVKTLRSQIAEITQDLTLWRTWLQARRTLIWFPTYEAIYQALDAAITLIELKQQYPQGFYHPAPVLFKAYTSELYQFDLAYRHFIVASDKAQGDILKRELIDDIENLYTQWFLDGLGAAWSDSLGEKWEVTGVRSQTRFYRENVLPIFDRSDREKAFVIISDALRYEVAQELEAAIAQQLRGDINLTAQLGTLPSITRLGMAALLPGSKLELIPANDDVKVDELSSKGSLARQKILTQNSKVAATVIDAGDLLAMTIEEGRNAISSYRLIYIYHNVIDAIGDKPASERQVFTACDDAIQEIVRLVKKICNSLNGTNLFITSDHGFLYQRRPVQESEKRPIPNSEYIRESKRRYLLTSAKIPEPGLLHFSLNYAENAFAVIPRGTLRFGIQGAGSQFVHGGASLQEICVPLITYHHKRATKDDEGLARKVNVQVSARERRVTNNRFSLTLVQSEAVEGRWRSRQITVALYNTDSNTPITDVKKIELSSSSPHPSERDNTVRLTIATSNPPTRALLIIRDADDDSELVREDWTISLSIANDFGDF
jgi:uncharacterized protein (TIGR02687 family)